MGRLRKAVLSELGNGLPQVRRSPRKAASPTRISKPTKNSQPRTISTPEKLPLASSYASRAPPQHTTPSITPLSATVADIMAITSPTKLVAVLKTLVDSDQKALFAQYRQCSEHRVRSLQSEIDALKSQLSAKQHIVDTLFSRVHLDARGAGCLRRRRSTWSSSSPASGSLNAARTTISTISSQNSHTRPKASPACGWPSCTTS